MHSVYNYVVEPLGERYNNSKKVGDKELILNTEVFNHQHVNREARILSVPSAGAPLNPKVGDIVTLHHNVFRRWHDVKGKERNSGNETFFHNGKTFKFERNDPTLFFMQRLRDEAHRFAITSHRAKRAKGMKKSLLDQINGIGAIRKRALLNHF